MESRIEEETDRQRFYFSRRIEKTRMSLPLPPLLWESGAHERSEGIQSNLEYIFMSGSAKLVAISITYPYQVIRSRIQVRNSHYLESNLKSDTIEQCDFQVSTPPIQLVPSHFTHISLPPTYLHLSLTSNKTLHFNPGCNPSYVRP